jgi:small conductance mechanosensitive channel
VERTLSSFLSHLCYWLIITIVVLVALQNAQFETTPFSAVLGASALAVGLALQNSLANFAAGVLIILFRHFRVGDEIETGTVRGIVEEISIFSTNMRTFDNRTIIIPNGSILSSPLFNNSAKPTRRLDIVFNISYGSDLRRARQVILEVLKKDARTQTEPEPVVAVTNLGESSVDLTMRAWVKTEDYYDLRAAMLEAVKLKFDETGIEIPFPQHEIHVRQKA